MGGLRGHRPLCPPDRNGRGEQGSANSEVLCTLCSKGQAAQWGRGWVVALGRWGRDCRVQRPSYGVVAWWPALMVKEEIWGPGSVKAVAQLCAGRLGPEVWVPWG